MILRQEQQLHERFFGLERALRFGDGAQLSVKDLDDVGRVHDPSYVTVVLEVVL